MIPTINEECGEFLKQSNGNYLIKNLPRNYMGFTRVKVRLSRKRTQFIEDFNRAFDDKRKEFYGSSIFAYSRKELLVEEEGKEPFYIFPIDGFKHIYNPLVSNVEDELNCPELKGMVTELLDISYVTEPLHKALSNSCEIIFYNIPYYYAVRKSLVGNYHKFFYE